jgi:hypothetical protein
MWKARAEQAEQRVKDMERVGVAFCEQMERANVELPLDAISEYNALAVLLSRRGREG